METKIFIFGDSIAHGACDFEAGGWVNRLKKYIDTKVVSDGSEFTVYNLGVDGDISEGIVNRFEFEIYQRLSEGDEKVFIFAVGINDSSFFEGKNENRINSYEFKENLQYLTALAKKYSEKIVFVGITPVDETRIPEFYTSQGIYYKNENIKEYNETIKGVCERNKLIFIDILSEFSKTADKNELLDEDGLHPNSAGHKKIFEIVKKSLMEGKLI